ncbi:hypothetical protein Dsin_008567 [Dipteronia sinensis]|uniref:RNase H type-1 domain-containing protein n=1 Tax=Dipteronia sinensis TaxID=43782 RepID=A0AAE0EBA3_9ROSI|nr:hypothetical protein Dsin_008567 [Dipteronia sinensis]
MCGRGAIKTGSWWKDMDIIKTNFVKEDAIAILSIPLGGSRLAVACFVSYVQLCGVPCSLETQWFMIPLFVMILRLLLGRSILRPIFKMVIAVGTYPRPILPRPLKFGSIQLQIAKALAILRGILFVMDASLSPLSVESNAAVVVKWFNNGSHQSSEVGVILSDIISLVKDQRCVSINHTPLDGNHVAHLLAKYALCCNEDRLYT